MHFTPLPFVTQNSSINQWLKGRHMRAVFISMLTGIPLENPLLFVLEPSPIFHWASIRKIARAESDTTRSLVLKCRFTVDRSCIWDVAEDCNGLGFLHSFKAKEAFILVLYLANCCEVHQFPLKSVKPSYPFINFCVHVPLKEEASHIPEQAIKGYRLIPWTSAELIYFACCFFLPLLPLFIITLITCI